MCQKKKVVHIGDLKFSWSNYIYSLTGKTYFLLKEQKTDDTFHFRSMLLIKILMDKRVQISPFTHLRSSRHIRTSIC